VAAEAAVTENRFPREQLIGRSPCRHRLRIDAAGTCAPAIYAECTVSPCRIACSFCRARQARSCLSSKSQPPLPACMHVHSGAQSHSSPRRDPAASSTEMAGVETPLAPSETVARRPAGRPPPSTATGGVAQDDKPTTASRPAPPTPDAAATALKLSQRGSTACAIRTRARERALTHRDSQSPRNRAYATNGPPPTTAARLRWSIGTRRAHRALRSVPFPPLRTRKGRRFATSTPQSGYTLDSGDRSPKVFRNSALWVISHMKFFPIIM
jgi:hypothetical protein